MQSLSRSGRAVALAFVAAAIAVAAVVVVACGSNDELVEPDRWVPTRWHEVRESEGHLVHLTGKEPLKCADCHDKEFNPPSASVCEGCHTDTKITMHTTVLAMANTECINCHPFGDDPTVRADNCARCHQQSQGFKPPISGHAGASCTLCHNPHTNPALDPPNCEFCHPDRIVTHGRNTTDDRLGCQDCHDMHGDVRGPERECQSCHSKKPILVSARAVFKDGHDKCTNCHQPHKFDKSQVAACDSCHKNQPVLAAQKVRKHRQCTTCHEPHDVRAASVKTCESCHRRVSSQHPVTPKGTNCLGCHPPHPDRRTMASGVTVAACSSCHKDAGGDLAYHASGQTACVSCHQPHGRGGFEPECGSCHKEQLAQTRLVARRGHADCKACHGADSHHDPTGPRKACETCHKDEKQTAPRGHSDCNSCHQTHSGQRLAKAQCASCHQERTAGPHVKVRGGCTTCHRAHGPRGVAKPPTCETCHEPSRLPSLHKVAQHQTCSNCHRVHQVKPQGDRAGCTAGKCHTDQKRHEPAAKSCVGCHIFRSE